MRRFSALVLALIPAIIAPPSPASGRAGPPDFAGAWKLVVLPASEVEFAIVDLKPGEGGRVAATLVAANEKLIGPIDSAGANVVGDRVALRLIAPGRSITFLGTIDADGQVARGTIKGPGGFFRARLERTKSTAVAAPSNVPTPLVKDLASTQSIPELKDRVARILELVAAHPGDPINTMAYAQALMMAESAGMPAEEAGKVAARWLDEARPYGPGWVGETQAQLLRALQGKKAYAALATEVGQAAEKALPADATAEQRGAIATLLAESARLAGNEAVAAEAEARAREADVKLDAEYLAKVPPFRVRPYAGRPGGKGTRVVLVEAFSGAECRPCVVPDVAFDALLKAYRPTEMIGLQYHLHVPGPDPLTNPDTITRAESDYTGEIQSTPAIFINGIKFGVPGGTDMPEAEVRYNQFRRLIDPDLTEERLADIDLAATRSGDEVKIDAKARVVLGPRRARPRLRVALIEKTVRYAGGNRLRIHHNVVRFFPGGVQGRSLDDGQGSINATVNLGELRKAQEAYLKAFAAAAAAAGKPFPNPIPPFDLDDLAVVAFVQNDVNRAVWHARQVDLDPPAH